MSKAKAAIKRWNQSEKGKDATKRYQQSEKGKASKKRYYCKRNGGPGPLAYHKLAMRQQQILNEYEGT